MNGRGKRFARALQRPAPQPVAVPAPPQVRKYTILPFYAGIRIIETVRPDLDDIQLSAGKGTLRVLGKGDKIREIPIHPQLRTDLHLWLHERPDWPEATRNPALLLNNRGGRLTSRGASGIFRQIADNAGCGGPGAGCRYHRRGLVSQRSRRGCVGLNPNLRDLGTAERPADLGICQS